MNTSVNKFLAGLTFVTRRRASRLAAVQALYALAVSGDPAERVIADVCERHWGSSEPAEEMAPPDPTFVGTLVNGANAQRGELDGRIDAALSHGWSLARLELLLQAILRLGAFELQALPEVPSRVVITEYLEITHAFFAGKEPSLVNAVLDRLASELRGVGEGIARQGNAGTGDAGEGGG